jgi:acyl-CoA thioester hydrolase
MMALFSGVVTEETISVDCDDGAMSQRPYCVDVPLRWSDMDAYGHVNNVQFLRLLEDARVIGFRQWFGPDPGLLDEGVVVARHEIEYLAPLDFRHEPIRVDMWATKISGSSFNLAYEVRDPTEVGTTMYARAETTLVAYDFTTGSPRRLRPDERTVLKGVSGDPVPFRWRQRAT